MGVRCEEENREQKGAHLCEYLLLNECSITGTGDINDVQGFSVCGYEEGDPFARAATNAIGGGGDVGLGNGSCRRL